MNRKVSVLGGLTAAVLFSGALWGAILQSQTNKQFSVAITDPARNGVEVGREMVVKGTASIPSGNYLWVLLHRTEGYKTVWYPQEQGEIDAKTKRWSARAVFDGPK